MVEAELASWLEIGSLVVETIIVILLIKTVRDYAEVAKMSRLQTEQRFRPWIGPTSGIEFLRSADGKHQFSVTIKNFGEIPATNVVAASMARPDAQPTRDTIQQSDGLSKFTLGPLLPNMEKRYWIFVDSDSIEKTRSSNSQLFTYIHFSYDYHGGKSGYGMISQFDPKGNAFVHKEMWVD